MSTLVMPSTVCHDKVFVRLASYGIGGPLLERLRQFFCNRSHQTRVGSSLSGASMPGGPGGPGPLIFC